MLMVICLGAVKVSAQKLIIMKGAAIDTSSKSNISDVTVSFLNAKDSVLQKFVYSNSDGQFTLTAAAPGDYILLMSCPGYADYTQKFTVDYSRPVYDFGRIIMPRKAVLLHEVIVKGIVSSIRIKGDTTIYNARAYKVQANDKVENLLKQLPGIQVNQYGKITAYGQVVAKVLLDGEEFFSDDPTLITQNIRADMVDKVQLYDKKSDAATFTGINDGIKIKTINIQLKEDKKKGIFGKLSASAGNNNYHSAQATFNRFSGNAKYAVYGTFANDGKIGPGSADNSKMDSRNVRLGSNALINTTAGTDALDTYDGVYDGKGNPLAKAGGVHYDEKWADNKQFINMNFRIGSIGVKGENTEVTQQNLSSGFNKRSADESYDNHSSRQKFDIVYGLNIDSLSDLKLALVTGLRDFNINNNYHTRTENEEQAPVNEQNREVTNTGKMKTLDVSLLYTRKFRKPRRTFSWSLSENSVSYDTKGYLKSFAGFFDPVKASDSISNVNQFKVVHTSDFAFNTSITYTEPLSKTFTIALSTGATKNDSKATRLSFNQSAPGIYNTPDSLYSNRYRFNQFANDFGLIFTYSKGKSNLNFGSKLYLIEFKQFDEFKQNSYKRHFVYPEPQAFYSYQISQQQNLLVFYRGSNMQPAIAQLQPVATNIDPLNITIGNPDLKPSFSNNIGFNYHYNSIVNNQSFLVQADYSLIANAITSNTSTNVATGETILQYQQIKGRQPVNYRLFAAFDKKLLPINMDLSLNVDARGSSFYNYINGVLNVSNAYNYTASIGIGKSVADSYNFFLSAGPAYTINKFSLQESVNNNAAGLNSNCSILYFLPYGFRIATDVSYTYSAGTTQFSAINRTIWNASIYKVLLKSQNLRISFGGNDLLNQNLIFSRSINGNNISQNTYSGIRRYYSVAVSWDFNKFGKSPVNN